MKIKLNKNKVSLNDLAISDMISFSVFQWYGGGNSTTVKRFPDSSFSSLI